MRSGNFSHAVLVLLSGLPGAGKTTFAQALTARIPAEHIESDAIRRSLFPAPRYLPAEHRRVFNAVERQAAAAITAGRVPIVDATNLTRRDRARFVRLADRTGARLVSVRLTATDAVLRERLSLPRTGFSEAGVAVYEGMRGRPQSFPTPVVTVDTRFALETSLTLVVRLLGES
jgi:predicted kinase